MRYFKVYFRIKSSYQGHSGFASDEQREAFYSEIAAIFTNNGWEIIPSGHSGGCDTVKKGKQELYLHPMSFSGVICEDSIDHLHSLLSADTLKTFSCYYVDIPLCQANTRHSKKFVEKPVTMRICGFTTCRISGYSLVLF